MITIIVAVLASGIVTTIINGLFMRRKTQAETGQISAQTTNSIADAAAVFVEAATTLVAPQSTQILELHKDISELRVALAAANVRIEVLEAELRRNKLDIPYIPS